MKVLIISQYFTPEPGATSHRIESFVETLTARGHQVTVISEFPNHPTGELASSDKWRLFRTIDKGSFRVINTFVMAFQKKNTVTRLLFYLSFALSSFFTALFMRRRDVIFVSSPPIFHAFSAVFAAKLKRSKLVVDIRDVWPDAVTEVEAVSEGRLVKYSHVIERMIYRSADLILTTTRGFKEMIESRGGRGKTHICYNGTFESIIKGNEYREGFRSELGWKGKVIITYAGLIGLAQNLTDILKEIKNSPLRDVLYVFIGSGPLKEEFVRTVAELELSEVKVIDVMPLNQTLPYLYHSDLLLVTLREREFFKIVIPSKFFDCMAAGKPILSNVDGELREIMEEHNTGLYFSLQEPGSLKRAIETLSNNPDKIREMGDNGKKLVAARFLRSKLTADAVKLMEDKLKI